MKNKAKKTKEHICITVWVIASGKGACKGPRGGGQGVENGDLCNSVNNKNKEKIGNKRENCIITGLNVLVLSVGVQKHTTNCPLLFLFHHLTFSQLWHRTCSYIYIYFNLIKPRDRLLCIFMDT